MDVNHKKSQIALPREGTKFRNTYRIDNYGTTVDINAKEFNAKHGIDGIIRIHNDVYETIDDTLTRFTHFNLEFSGHQIGKTYAMPRIVKFGYYRSDADECPPVLSFDNIYIVRCVSVSEHVPFVAIRDDSFRTSMSHIKDVDALKKEMLFRYAISLPNLTKKQILSMGVSITTLRFMRRNEHLVV